MTNETKYVDRTRFILEEISEEDRVLDLGCVQHSYKRRNKSKDFLHEEISNITDKLVGIDIEKEEINKLNKRGYNIQYADAQDFNLEEKFDVIVAGEIIEHVSNPSGLLESVTAHLAEEGKFIVSFPNVLSFHRIRKALLYKDITENPQHVLNFTEYTMKNLLNRHNFKIVKIKHTNQGIRGCEQDLFVNFFRKIRNNILGSRNITIVTKDIK